MSNVQKSISVSKDNWQEPPEERRSFSSLNILRVESYLFDYSTKSRGKNRLAADEERNFVDPHSGKPVVVIPSLRYGIPGTPAYQIWDAYQRRLSTFGYPLPKSLSFGYRELDRLIGSGNKKNGSRKKATNGGWQNDQLKLYIKQLRHTEINLWFNHPDGEGWKQEDINLFSKSSFSGHERGKISQIVLTLHEDLREDLNRLAYCMNHSRLADLDPIGKLLFKYLYFSLCRRFQKSKNENFRFVKSYENIVTDWLGGMAIRKYPKDIKRQLSSRLDSIRDRKLISSWKLEKNKGGSGYNITFRPGRYFFNDYWNYYVAGYWFLQTCDATLGQGIRDPEVEAHELVTDFHSKRTGNDVDGAFFYDKEIDLAKSILYRLSLDEAFDFNSYALEQAKRTDFNPKVYTACKHYFADFLSVKEERAERGRKAEAMKKRQVEEAKQQKLEREYESFTTAAIDSFKQSIGKREVASIEHDVRLSPRVQWREGEVLESLVKIEMNKIYRERAGIPNFEEWLQQNNLEGELPKTV